MCLKNYGLVAVNDDPILNMGSHGAREYNLFQVAALSDEVLDCIAMRDADYILLDDWPVIEDLGHIVAGRADQLHTALERLMVRPCPDERWKERVVDVDNLLRIAVHEVIRQDLH